MTLHWKHRQKIATIQLYLFLGKLLYCSFVVWIHNHDIEIKWNTNCPETNKSQKQCKKKEGNALYIGEKDDDVSNKISDPILLSD